MCAVKSGSGFSGLTDEQDKGENQDQNLLDRGLHIAAMTNLLQKETEDAKTSSVS